MSNGTACAGFDCGPICIGACKTSVDCPSSIVDLDYYCGFSTPAGYETPLRMCIPKRHMGSGEDGASCSANGDCHDLACISGACADTCCSNADCRPGEHCRPVYIRGQWETHCL